MKRYEEYKESGIDWLGEIPSHWNISRLKYIAECRDKDRKPLSAEERGCMQGKIPYWGANNIIDYIDDYLIDEEVVLLGEDGVPFFDKTKPVAFYSNQKIWANNHIHVLKPQSCVDARFLTFALNSVDFTKYITGSTRDKLTQGDMKNIIIGLPPTKEQEQIATYLDEKVGKLDRVIENKEKLIEQLTKAKGRLISEAVTKGLDKEVELKDSGVEWIGKIPSHWGVKPVKHMVSKNEYYPIGDGDHGCIKPEMYREEGIPYIRVQNLTWGNNLNFTNIVYISKEVNNLNKKSILKPKDILIAKTGATVGKTAIIPEDIVEANTTSSVGKVTVNHKNINYKYVAYYFQSKSFITQINLTAYQKSAQPGFNISDLINYKVSLPKEYGEQEQIATYLDEKVGKIDRLLEITREEIELLRKAKAKLISDVVTGKRDVRGEK